LPKSKYENAEETEEMVPKNHIRWKEEKSAVWDGNTSRHKEEN